VTTVVASDDGENNGTITYSIAGGADAALFTINATTGALSFIGTPDFEFPTDAGANNVYDVTVQASDGTLTDTQAIAVTVTNVNEAPFITSNGGGDTATVFVPENTTAVTDVDAGDKDAGTTITYSIAGGADAALFTIDPSTGVLSFVTAPDFEHPTDNGGDNVYDVVVKASDGSLSDLQSIAVHVTDVSENVPPVANSDVLWVSNNTTVTLPLSVLMANDVDPDGLAETITGISVSSGSLAGPVTINPDGTFTFTTGAAGGTVAAPSVVTLTYTTSDGLGGTSTGTVTVDIVTIQPGTTSDSINLTGVGAYAASYIDGGAGADTLTDGSGLATLLGGVGADILTGNAGNDLLIGGDNNDTLSGGAGNDILRGGIGNNDSMDGGAGTEDLLDFSDGSVGITFTLDQTAGVHAIANGTGGLGNNDTYQNIEGVIGTAFVDHINGSNQNDIIRGGGGDDVLNGGGGTGDLIDFSDGTSGITLTFTQGAGVANVVAAGLGTDSYQQFEGIIGTNFDDTITGSNLGDIIRGGGGNDTLNGGGGNDTITGGAGADTLTGGTGNDTFVMTPPLNAVDTITDYSNVAGNADVIDLTQILNVPLGGNAIADGFLRVTTTGLLQVDLNGGGDNWITVANVNTAGVPSYTIQYLLNGVSTTANLTPVAPPIGIDLNGDGQVSFLGTDAGVAFDYGYGKVGTAWVGPQDGILVNDANHDGQASANEIVFSTGGSDLEGLAQYDTNHDGQLTAADAGFSQFAVWQDANSNGVVDAGEMKSLAALGITGISLSSDGIGYSAAGGDVQVVGTGSVTYADGRTGILADAVFATGQKAGDGELRVAAAMNGNAALLGAVAAAGLAAMPAHAEFRESAGAHSEAQFGPNGVATAQPSIVEATAQDHALSNETAVPLGTAVAAPTVHSSAALPAGTDMHATATAGSEPVQHIAELLQGTSAPHANPAATPLAAAAAISPVTAEMLQAAMAGVQHAAERPGATVDPSAHGSAELGHVLADALAIGNGKPDIESLLHAVGGPAHDQVLSHTALGSSGAHELFGSVHVEDRMLMMHDTIMLHQLAAPPH
jgi:Ca2+-binding RTX toxin-like protein